MIGLARHPAARKCLAAAMVFVFVACGETSEPAVPDREVSVVMRDDFTYEPAEIEVTAGETIAFEVHNEGDLVHEFVIGTTRQHAEHEQQMAEGGEHAEHESELKGVAVAAGKRKTFTFAVPAEGTLSFGCHEPGHYEKGMKGSFRYLQPPRR